ncbi:uncharacterized protein [Mytilus edulis]|uniref:uncharacterized protein n=1 Tax=Mytilus edulis TaxID=6550 RepID=UPI0039EE0762
MKSTLPVTTMLLILTVMVSGHCCLHCSFRPGFGILGMHRCHHGGKWIAHGFSVVNRDLCEKCTCVRNGMQCCHEGVHITHHPHDCHVIQHGCNELAVNIWNHNRICHDGITALLF